MQFFFLFRPVYSTFGSKSRKLYTWRKQRCEINQAFCYNLDLECFQNTIDFLKFVDLSNKIVSIAPCNLSVSNVNHTAINVEVNLKKKC